MEELYVVDVGGATPGAPVKVNGTMVGTGTTGGDILSYQWSPNGRWLAYEADQDTDSMEELYVVDMSGATPGAPVKVSGTMVGTGSLGGDITGYAWSPDSTRLAYRADQNVDNQDDLFVVDLSTGTPSAPVKVNGAFANASMDVNDFEWSPDGTRLAYDADQETYLMDELYLVIFGATGPGTPINVSGLTNVNSDVWDWRWSPNGLYLLFRADKDIIDADELYVVFTGNPTPGAPVNITALPATGDVTGPTQYAWSPDSKWVAFVADKDTDAVNELYLVDLGGTTPSAPIKASGTMVAGGAVVAGSILFSPTATGLVYEADQDTDAVEELYWVSLSGTTPAPARKLSGTMLVASDSLTAKWFRDGTLLAYRTDAEADTVYELFMSALTSGTPSAPVKMNSELPALGDVTSMWEWQP
jgi:Tol biopolymer transport system component